MKPPEAQESDHDDVDGRVTTDNRRVPPADRMVITADRVVTSDGRLTAASAAADAGRRQRQPSPSGVESGSRRSVSSAAGTSPSHRWSLTLSVTHAQTDTAANGDHGQRRRHNVDENGGSRRNRHGDASSGGRHVMITDKAREISLSNDEQQWRRPGALRNDHTTTTTSATAAATGTTTTTTTASTDDLDVLNVETTLPEMNWDRLEEQLRNALQLDDAPRYCSSAPDPARRGTAPCVAAFTPDAVLYGMRGAAPRPV